jgi:hypothetical protein
MDIKRAGSQSGKAPADWFTGTVRDGKAVDWMEHVTDAQYAGKPGTH